MHGRAGEIHMRCFSNFRHRKWDNRYSFHSDRDNNSEFHIRSTFEANNMENALGAFAEFPCSFRIGTTSSRFNGGRRIQSKTPRCPSFCGPNPEPCMDHQLRRRREQRWWKFRDTLRHSDNHRELKRGQSLCFAKSNGELTGRRKASVSKFAPRGQRYARKRGHSKVEQSALH